jgi:seryl-tRNA synthetase
MLDINLFRENPDQIREALKLRQMDTDVVDHVIELDRKRRSLIAEVEGLKATRNTESKKIGRISDP